MFPRSTGYRVTGHRENGSQQVATIHETFLYRSGEHAYTQQHYDLGYRAQRQQFIDHLVRLQAEQEGQASRSTQ